MLIKLEYISEGRINFRRKTFRGEFVSRRDFFSDRAGFIHMYLFTWSPKNEHIEQIEQIDLFV